MVDQGMAEPLVIMEQFKQYSFLMETTTREVYKDYFGKTTKQKDIEEVDKELVESGLREFQRAMQEVLFIIIYTIYIIYTI